MTKLEEKLIQLGYEYRICEHRFIKINKDLTCIFIEFDRRKFEIKWCGVQIPNNTFLFQQDIDNLQQAFNQLQLDLEVLKDE